MSAVQAIFSRIFSLRLIVLLLALALVASSYQARLFDIINQSTLKIAISINPLPPSTPHVTIVELTPQELGNFTHNVGNASEIVDLFDLLLAKHQHRVALIIDEPPVFFDNSQEHMQRALSGELGSVDTESTLYNEMQTRDFQRKRIYKWLMENDIILGQKTDASIKHFSGQEIQINSPVRETYFQYLPPHLIPTLPHLIQSPAQSSQFTILPFQTNDSIGRQILWSSENKILAGFIASLSVRNDDTFGATSSPTWQQYGSLSVGKNENKPLGFNGDFVPFYGQLTQLIPKIDSYSLQEALITAISTPVVLIGEKDSSQLHALAYDLTSFRSNAYAYTPDWQVWLNITLITVFAITVILLIPRLTPFASFFFICFLLFGLLVGQLGWLITQKQWLPMGGPVVFLLTGYLLMLVRYGPRKRIQRLESENHLQSIQLSEMLLQRGDLELAFNVVRHCTSSVEVLDLLYNIGAQQERKRQYGQAITTYKTITAKKRSYKDAAARTKKLLVIQVEEAETSLEFAATQSMVLPQVELKKPVLGRYQVIREIGRGATGVVYLGTDPKISRQVAIKTLAYNQFDENQIEDVKARFYREAEAAGRLDHPYIVTVYDIGEESDLAFIAMDYVEGKSLNAFTREPQLLPIATVYNIIANVADALDYAHQQNIVHRDIKPGNIIYNPKNEIAKVTDFGIARLTDDSRTKTGEIFGSPVYMSPEQLKGGKVTGTADIYSLGITFYQLLAGVAPFGGDSLAELTLQIIQKKHTNIREVRSELPASANRIINKALQKDPSKRYQTAKEMSEAVRKSIIRDFPKETA